MEGVQTSGVKVVAPNGDQPSLPTPRPVNQICPYCGYAFQTVPALVSHIAGCATKTLQSGNAPVAAFPANAPAPTAGCRRGKTRAVATGEAREMVGKTQIPTEKFDISNGNGRENSDSIGKIQY
jgi:hypothetical protein